MDEHLLIDDSVPSRKMCHMYVVELHSLLKNAPKGRTRTLPKDHLMDARNFIKHSYHLVNHHCTRARTEAMDTIQLFMNPQALHSAPGDRQPRSVAVQRWTDGEFDSCEIAGQCEEHHRVKRQLVLLGALIIGAGIVAIGSMMLSSAKLVDMSATITTGPNDETIQALQDHETRISINEAALKRTKKAAIVLSQVLGTLTTFVETMIAVQVAEGYIMDLTAEALGIMRGLRSVSELKFSPDLVPPTALRLAVEKLRVRLDRLNIQILPNQGHEFYALETSFVYREDDTLTTFLHIPGYTRGSLMDMYEYIPTPLEITKDRFFLPNPAHTILVVDPVDTSKYRSMSRGDLSLCRHSGSRYYCPGQNFYRKHVGESCLMDLFQNRIKSIADNCPFVPLKPNHSYLVQISPIEFVVYYPGEGERLIVVCGGSAGKSETIQIAGVRRLVIPSGCRASSTSFNFEGEVDIFMQDDNLAPRFHTVANLTSYFPKDLLTAELDEVMEDLHLIGSPEGVKIKDLASILMKSRNKYKFEFSLGIVGTIVAFLVLLLTVFFCCIKATGPDDRSITSRILRSMSRKEKRDKKKVVKKEKIQRRENLEMANMASLAQIAKLAAGPSAEREPLVALPPEEFAQRQSVYVDPDQIITAGGHQLQLHAMPPRRQEDIVVSPPQLQLHYQPGRTPAAVRRYPVHGVHSPDI